MSQQEPLQYEPVTRPRPPKRPLAALVCILGGGALFFLRPDHDALGFIFILGATVLQIAGAVLLLKFVGEMMDYQGKSPKR